MAEFESPLMPNGLRVILFKVAGVVACAVKGRSSMYSWYIAQSKVECGQGWSSRAFVDDCNAFGLSKGAARRNDDSRVGDTGPGGSGSIAQYQPRWGWRLLFPIFGLATMNAYYRCWLDRIEWDERYNITTESLDAWAHDVANHGYKGGANATQAERDAYAIAITGQYKEDEGSSGLRWSLLMFLVWFLLLVLAYVLLRRLWRFLIYGRWKRKRKG